MLELKQYNEIEALAILSQANGNISDLFTDQKEEVKSWIDDDFNRFCFFIDKIERGFAIRSAYLHVK